VSAQTKALLESALALPPIERAILVQELLSSLDRPDPEIDAAWAVEAESRIEAYDAGSLPAVPYEDVLRETGAQ
jgi:putative addiction module component (TIGR02574 family)